MAAGARIGENLGARVRPWASSSPRFSASGRCALGLHLRRAWAGGPGRARPPRRRTSSSRSDPRAAVGQLVVELGGCHPGLRVSSARWHGLMEGKVGPRDRGGERDRAGLRAALRRRRRRSASWPISRARARAARQTVSSISDAGGEAEFVGLRRGQPGDNEALVGPCRRALRPAGLRPQQRRHRRAPAAPRDLRRGLRPGDRGQPARHVPGHEAPDPADARQRVARGDRQHVVQRRPARRDDAERLHRQQARHPRADQERGGRVRQARAFASTRCARARS